MSFFLCSYAYGQMENFDYKRELKGTSEQWHKIILPDGIFAKASPDLSDIRLLGITADNDTIEAPYLLRMTKEELVSKDIPFKRLNTSYNNRGHFFTFEVPVEKSINQIDLDFEQQNFDWQVSLEGSQNQQEWFTVLENHRILSIKNNQTDFQFTKLTFPNSSYRFFRIVIDTKDKPNLIDAKIWQNELTDGVFKNYPVKEFRREENKQLKQSEVYVVLETAVPVSQIKIAITDAFDYYRPFTLQYLADSVKTEKGWRYIYRTLKSGTLNSLETNDFKVKTKTVQNLKLIIHNQDNHPLTIDNVKVSGYVHELIVRFIKPGRYFLMYGNENVNKPRYDIFQYSNKIPDTLTVLDLGEEQQQVKKEEKQKVEPLFKNKTSLWLIMILIIVLLGWFSMKMIRKE